MSDNDQSKNSGEQWCRGEIEEVLDRLGSSAEGLARGKANSRFEQHGPNLLESKPEFSGWKVLLHQFARPVIYVLMLALGITLAIQSWDNAVVIGIALISNGVLSSTQKYRAESAVQSPMETVSPTVVARSVERRARVALENRRDQ